MKLTPMSTTCAFRSKLSSLGSMLQGLYVYIASSVQAVCRDRGDHAQLPTLKLVKA